MLKIIININSCLHKNCSYNRGDKYKKCDYCRALVYMTLEEWKENVTSGHYPYKKIIINNKEDTLCDLVIDKKKKLCPYYGSH